MSLKALTSFLHTQPAGPLEATAHLQALLIDAWDSLEGCDAGGMQSYKLAGRIENPNWESPLLTFEIARHGAVARSSVYAEVQIWTVDITTGRASYAEGPRRLVRKKSPSINARLIGQEISEIVNCGDEDIRVEWVTPTEFRLQIDQTIPVQHTPKQTLASRRKKLYQALESELKKTGWNRRSKSSTFMKNP